MAHGEEVKESTKSDDPLPAMPLIIIEHCTFGSIGKPDVTSPESASETTLTSTSSEVDAIVPTRKSAKKGFFGRISTRINRFINIIENNLRNKFAKSTKPAPLTQNEKGAHVKTSLLQKIKRAMKLKRK
jgi:hypothetical protein